MKNKAESSAWKYELKVITTLAQENRPMYIAIICQSGEMWKDAKSAEIMNFNKPSMKTACQRLVKMGILGEVSDVKGHQSSRRHYYLLPALGTISKIYLRQGESVLSLVRQSGYGQMVISGIWRIT